MTENVRKSRLQVSLDVDVGNLKMRAIGTLDQLLRRFAATLDNVLRITLEKYLAD
jgi:hypothetical protein